MYRALFSTFALILSVVILAPLYASAAVPFQEGRVTFTFDDGWQSTFDNARPILNAAGVETTQFIYSDAMNQVHGAIYMTAEELRTMQGEGHDIQAHSRTHADLSLATSSDALDFEIAGSRIDLLGEDFSPVTAFAYPYGVYSNEIIARVQSAEFLGARTVDEGYNFSDDNPYTLKIQHVTNTTTVEEIEGWIETARTDKTWLILMFHETVPSVPENCISTDLTECTTTTILQGAVGYVTGSTTAICVLTMAEALTSTPCGSVTPPTNHAPIVANAIPDQNATEDGVFSYSFAANTFSDEDGDTLSYSAPTLPLWLSFASTTRTFTGTPTNTDVGSHTTVVRATDPDGAFVEDTFTITVGNTNAAPTISTSTFSVAENSASGTVVGTVSGSDSDAGDTLTYEMLFGNTGNAFALDPNSGVITVNNKDALDFETTPVFTILIRVMDSSALSAEATTTIQLTNVDESTPEPEEEEEETPPSSGGGGGGIVGLIGTVNVNPYTPYVPFVQPGVVLGTSTAPILQFVFTKPLVRGMQGEDIMELHKILIKKGYLKISAPTGWFGPMTFAAIQALQRDNGIEMLGAVGPKTRAVLNALQ